MCAKVLESTYRHHFIQCKHYYNHYNTTNSMEKQFVCSKCGNPNILIDVDIPYMGQRCKECNFVHVFAKQKEFKCDTLGKFPKDQW